jgi:hypothetical protein
MDPISKQELEGILRKLPANKSPRPSRISNKFWKKAPEILEKRLRELLNNCIVTEDMPAQ